MQQTSPRPYSPAATTPAPPPPPPRASSTSALRATTATTTTTTTTTTAATIGPVTEAKRNLALLLGDDAGKGGLVDQLERTVSHVLDSIEHAFDPQTPSPDLDSMYDLLDSIINVLSRSSLGGQPASAPESTTNTTDLAHATWTVQTLFKELQRTREGAEIARTGLAG
ncbi:hypothetical protein JCM3766R1_001819 [Sporobolomyces carnicolor]